MDWPDHAHPIWRIIRFAVCVVLLTVIMWFNAETFDRTELRAIFWFLVSAGSVETAGAFVKRIRSKRDE